jgi:hypothetical protein
MTKPNRTVLALGLLLLSAGTAAAQAKSFQPFRVDIGVSGLYAPPSGRGGFGAVVEPKFAITDFLHVGLRSEGGVMFGGSLNGASDAISVGVGAVGTFQAKGELLLGHGLRPIVGLGIGMYAIVSQDVGVGDENVQVRQVAGKYFGISPQLGLDFGPVRLSAVYNIILGADIEVVQNAGTTDEMVFHTSHNYMSVELSFRMGGKRKPRPAPIQ